MLFLYYFISTFFMVLVINLVFDKLVNNNVITKKVLLKNLVVCIFISLCITLFYYLQSSL